MVNCLLFVFSSIRCFPHLLVYLFVLNNGVIKDDLRAWRQVFSMEEHGLLLLLKLLIEKREFRNVFYIRSGRTLAGVLNVFLARRESVDVLMSSCDIGGGLLYIMVLLL